MKLRGSHAIQRSYVTYCKTGLQWAGERKTCKDFLKKEDVLSSFTSTFKEQPACTLSHGIFWSFYGGRSIQKRGKTRKNFTTFMRFF